MVFCGNINLIINLVFGKSCIKPAPPCRKWIGSLDDYYYYYYYYIVPRSCKSLQSKRTLIRSAVFAQLSRMIDRVTYQNVATGCMKHAVTLMMS